MHWRTPRQTSGNEPSAGALQAQNSTRADNVIQLAARSSPARLNSRSQEGEPFIDPFELGSCFVFGTVVLLPITLVSAVVIGYLAFVA